jgi:hypothetical protein
VAVISAKHNVILWVPTALYVGLMLGQLGRGRAGEIVYRITMNGFLSCILIIAAAACISRGGRLFVVGVILWVLSLGALLMENHPLFVLHF